MSRGIDILVFMDYYVGMKRYYFALGDVLKDLNITPPQAQKRYFADKKNYLSRQTLYSLCVKPPMMIRTATQDKICNAIGITPADLWREVK